MPYSLQAMNSTTTSGIDYGGGRNADLAGKTPPQIMDIIIDAAAARNLMVILDNHSQADDGFEHDLWYGQNGFTEGNWVSRWQSMATLVVTHDRSELLGRDDMLIATSPSHSVLT